MARIFGMRSESPTYMDAWFAGRVMECSCPARVGRVAFWERFFGAKNLLKKQKERGFEVAEYLYLLARKTIEWIKQRPHEEVERAKMGMHRGITYAAFERLESLMALEESRHEAKKAMREASGDDPLVAPSTGKIHSYKSREKYQGVVRRFIAWCKEEQQLYRLELVDARAEELVDLYLLERLERGLTPDTIQGDRAGLRLFFQNWELGEYLPIPPRHREQITRSRQPAARDLQLPREIAEPLERFFAACGVRRDEANHLKAQDIQSSLDHRYQLDVVIQKGYGKGGRTRRAPVYPGREQDVLARLVGLSPDGRLFPHKVDSRLNPQAQRRQYAQDFYCYLSGRELPPTDRRLAPSDYAKDAALEVSHYLGHNRIDVILRSYLR